MSVNVIACSASQVINNKIPHDSTGQYVGGVLTIPEYQRPYCWQQHQLQQLLEDITQHSHHTPDLPYYLGSLILHQDNGKLNIIDGQQRVTTLAIISMLLDTTTSLDLSFESPTSHQQIKKNYRWLCNQYESIKRVIKLDQIQFTLVVTQSEDDAYRFFETQNTGGVRLGGPDIIKAHHLRAIQGPYQLTFARRWEQLGKLDNAITALLKGRYWQNLRFRELPTHRQEKQLRDIIVWEFAQQTGKGDDIAYGRARRHYPLSGEVSLQLAQQGYDLRQPLNAGINTVHYLDFFQKLYQNYFNEPDLPHLRGYQVFITWLKTLKGCDYLKKLYETSLMLYISHFGEHELELAAKKLFRVVYSSRVSNEQSVKEQTAVKFIRETPVFDWIAQSYTPQQCFNYLDEFTLNVSKVDLKSNNIKKRFIENMVNFFGLDLSQEEYEQKLASVLTDAINRGDKL